MGSASVPSNVDLSMSVQAANTPPRWPAVRPTYWKHWRSRCFNTNTPGRSSSSPALTPPPWRDHQSAVFLSNVSLRADDLNYSTVSWHISTRHAAATERIGPTPRASIDVSKSHHLEISQRNIRHPKISHRFLKLCCWQTVSFGVVSLALYMLQ